MLNSIVFAQEALDMHEIELLDEAIDVARQLGCDIRQDNFFGEGGGLAWVRGRKQLFLDLAQSATQQLEAVAGALRGEIQLANATMRPELAEYLDVRRIA